TPEGSAGRKSFLVRRKHTGQADTGGHLYKLLNKGHERLFVRMYVKIDQNCAPIHHFGTCMGGNNPARRWPVVKAGSRTDGARSMWIGIEPNMEQWQWDYYAYWHEMRGNPANAKYWGNS